MIEALDLMLKAYEALINTPNKTQRERSLIGNLYTQICLFGGQPYRIQMEKAKVLANRKLENPAPVPAENLANTEGETENTANAEETTEKKSEASEETEAKKSSENLALKVPAVQLAVVAAEGKPEKKKPGPKAKNK